MIKLVLVAAAILTLAVQVQAESVCRQYEYAELKEMDKSELIENYKLAFRNADRLMDNSSSELSLFEAKKCIDRVDDFTKQLKKRFKFSQQKIDALTKK